MRNFQVWVAGIKENTQVTFIMFYRINYNTWKNATFHQTLFGLPYLFVSGLTIKVKGQPWNIVIQLHNELNFDLVNLIDANIWDMAKLSFYGSKEQFETIFIQIRAIWEFDPIKKLKSAFGPFTNCPVSRKPSILWIYRVDFYVPWDPTINMICILTLLGNFLISIWPLRQDDCRKNTMGQYLIWEHQILFTRHLEDYKNVC